MVIIDDNNSNDGKFYNVIYVSCTQVMYDIWHVWYDDGSNYIWGSNYINVWK
jgi:hypothetical protein